MELWFDREGDVLEVTFNAAPGSFRGTLNDQVMETVDERGNVIGLFVRRVSSMGSTPLDIAL